MPDLLERLSKRYPNFVLQHGPQGWHVQVLDNQGWHPITGIEPTADKAIYEALLYATKKEAAEQVTQI